MNVVIFLIVLAVLIFVHELGHFVAARACGIRIDAFKIGFGPKLFAWKSGETEYGLNMIPFGGYVKIFGEDPDAENTNGPDAARSFVRKAKWQQALVLVSGVLFNFLFAWVVYSSLFATSIPIPADEASGFSQYDSQTASPRVVVTDILPDSPAAQAGLRQGDVIRSVGANAPVATSSSQALTIQDIQTVINSSAGQPIALTYAHGADVKTSQISATSTLVAGKYAIGIAMEDVVDLRLPVWAAVYEGLHYTGLMIEGTAQGLYSLVADLFHGHPDLSAVSGPVGIAVIVGNSATLGFAYLLLITAIISINLGIVNLIPFPALDGGRILFVAIESVIRRRIPAKFANIVNLVGFSLLMLLMVVVTWKDIAKLIWK